MNTLFDHTPVAALPVPRLDDIRIDDLVGAPTRSDPARRLAFEFGQSWLTTPEPEMRAGTAWLAATNDALFIWADLTDDCVRTFARDDHQPLWSLGDTFEVFLQPVGCEGYFEFEISPRGNLLQLHYPHVTSPREYGIDAYIVRGRRLVDFCVQEYAEGWRVALRVPVAPLLEASVAPSGERWRIAFCRYDYDAKGRFHLSSTAPLTQPAFHRIHEWHAVQVLGGFAAAPPPTA